MRALGYLIGTARGIICAMLEHNLWPLSYFSQSSLFILALVNWCRLFVLHLPDYTPLYIGTGWNTRKLSTHQSDHHMKLSSQIHVFVRSNIILHTFSLHCQNLRVPWPLPLGGIMILEILQQRQSSIASGHTWYIKGISFSLASFVQFYITGICFS
jgi:hypothetical protein